MSRPRLSASPPTELHGQPEGRELAEIDVLLDHHLSTRLTEVEAGRRLDVLLGPSYLSLTYPAGDASRSTASAAPDLVVDHAVTSRPGWFGFLDDRLLIPNGDELVRCAHR